MRLLITGCMLLAIPALAAEYELRGQVLPEESYQIHLNGANAPFTAGTISELDGRFRFRKLPAGAYTLIVLEPGHGEVRRTIEVGPSLADSKGRVHITIDLRSAQRDSDDALERSAKTSVRELSIPREAHREYEEADKDLARRDVPAAIAHLKRAAEIAPQFAAAWNHLGTIAYQTQQYPEAEGYFRKGLDADPNAYEPLVNLGGVLLNLGHPDEALKYNLQAVRRRPNDALANSQLGMSYFGAGNLDLAEQYLLAAQQVDPAHFSHPQMLLAEIYMRRNQPVKAADELDDLLKRHPDLPGAAKIRAEIARLRGKPAGY